MEVIYFSKTRRPEVEKELGIAYHPLDELLHRADIVTVHTPLTGDTTN